APLNLKATSGGSWVNLTWLAPADDGGSAITAYLIYRGNGSANFTLFATVNSSALCYNDTNVSSGNTYYYYVVAENAVGNSTASNQVNVTPQVGVTVPAAPRNLTVTSGAGYVNLTWEVPENNGGANITAYKIYRGTASGEEILIATVPATQLWYNDTSVSYGPTYYYYVDAVNSAGESDASNEVSIVVPQPVPELSSIVLTIVPLLAFMALRKRRL
ncbi:MAG: peptidase S53, partial [Euryarchaeota archaeon]|nr:peptidase S53 [Euryarchaeota archaeon]